MSIKSIIETAKQKTLSFAVRVRTNRLSAQEVLAKNNGELTALEIALGSIVSIVLCLLVLNSFTGVFNDSVMPKVKETIMSMFGG